MLDDLKLLLGLSLTDESKDELLELLLKNAKQYALLYTGLEGSTPALNVCIVKMAIYDYNRLGTEGLNSENYGAASYSYTDGYPQDILQMLDSSKSQGLGKLRILW